MVVFSYLLCILIFMIKMCDNGCLFKWIVNRYLYENNYFYKLVIFKNRLRGEEINDN